MKTVVSTSRDAAQSLPPGTRLNGIYEIERVIGAGGMGVVYKGRAIETGDAVAIKVVRTEMAHNSAAIDLFRKEAAVLHTLLHDAIVRYYVFTTDPGIERPYLATEFVDGEPLSDVMHAGALTRADGLALLVRLAEGLHAAHRAGVVHRDIAPDNIILPARDVRRAKIIDFGIARATLLNKVTLIGDSIAGKFEYMSPEQLGLYGGNVDPRSDIYSLGIVIAEALTGQRLGMGGSQADVVEKRRSVPPLVGIDPDIKQLLSQMLQPKPADRIASMLAIADAARLLADRSGKPKHRTPVRMAAAVLLVGLALGGAYVALDRRDTQENGAALPLPSGVTAGEREVAAPRPAPPLLVPRPDTRPAVEPPRVASPPIGAGGQDAGSAGAPASAGEGPSGRRDDGGTASAAGSQAESAAALPPTVRDDGAPSSSSPGTSASRPIENAGRRDGDDAAPSTAATAATTGNGGLGAAETAAASPGGETATAGRSSGAASAAPGAAPAGGTTATRPASGSAPDGAEGFATRFEGPDETMSDPERIVDALTADGSSMPNGNGPSLADDAASSSNDVRELAALDPSGDPTSGTRLDEGRRAAEETAPASRPPTASTTSEDGTAGRAHQATAVAPENGSPGAAGETEPAASPPSASQRVVVDSPPASAPVPQPPASQPPAPPPAAAEAGGDGLAGALTARRDGAAGDGSPPDPGPTAALLPSPVASQDLPRETAVEVPVARVDPDAIPSPPGLNPTPPPGAGATGAEVDATGIGSTSSSRVGEGGPSLSPSDGIHPPAQVPGEIIGVPVEPQDAAPPLMAALPSGAAVIERYLDGFDFGPCGLIRATALAPQSAELIGYGDTVDPFVEFDRAFTLSFGFEADIELRLVEAAQCPVVDFLHHAGTGTERLAVALDSDLIAPGRTLSGVVRGAGDRPLSVMVVAPDGTVYLLDEMLTRSGDEALLHTRVSGGEGGRAHLLVAVAGDALENLPATTRDSAAAVFGALSSAVQRGEDLRAGVAYFKFGS